MGADSLFLFLLLPLITGVIIAFMKGFLIGFGVGFLSIAAALFISGILNNTQILLYVAIIPFLFFLVCFIEMARRILKQHRVTNSLGVLREVGVALLHQGQAIENHSDRDSWWQKVGKWTGEVYAKMAEIRRVDSENWKLLGKYDPEEFHPTPYCRDMTNKLTQLSIWLKKLEHYIDTR